MLIYQQIWIKHNGPIPKDWEDRSFHIHHIDKNRNNNDISNLRCVSIREHYDIHWFQGDWGACFKLAKLLKLSPQEAHELNSLQNKHRIENGTHNLLNREESSKRAKKRVVNGTCKLLGGEVQKATNKRLLSNGTHNTQQTVTCCYCGKIGKGPGMFKHIKHCKYYQGKFTPTNRGKYKGDTNNIWYRSSWEAFYFSKLDRNEAILEWSSEEIIIPYISPVDMKTHRYFPDCYFAEKTSRGIERYIVEIKPKSQTKPPKVPKRKTKKYLKEIMAYSVNAAKWEAARQYCDKMGFKFIIATEKEVGVTWQ